MKFRSDDSVSNYVAKLKLDFLKFDLKYKKTHKNLLCHQESFLEFNSFQARLEA